LLIGADAAKALTAPAPHAVAKTPVSAPYSSKMARTGNGRVAMCYSGSKSEGLSAKSHKQSDNPVIHSVMPVTESCFLFDGLSAADRGKSDTIGALLIR
jgi:hypothetical protein